MTATVNTTPALAVPSAAPNAPILDDNKNKGGLVRLGKGINTAYEQVRGVLVSQPAQTGSALFSATSQVVRWRAKTLGYSGGEVSTEACEVWLLVTLLEITTGSATITVTQGSNTATYTYTTDKTAEWVQADGDLSVDDNAESLAITAELTASGDMATTELHGIGIYYKAARAVLVLDAYSQNGVHPINDEQVDDDSPLAAHLLHHMHRNIESTWQHRQGGNHVSTAYGPNNQVTSGHKYFLVYVPPGVYQFKVWFYEMGSSGGGGQGGGGSDEWILCTVRDSAFTQISAVRTSYTTVTLDSWDSATVSTHQPGSITQAVPDRTGQWLIIDVETNNMEYESLCIYSVNASR